MRRVSPLGHTRLFGRAGLDVVTALGRSTLFLGHAPPGRCTSGTRLHLLVKQFYSTGALSLVVIVVSGLFIGMALALQGYNILISYSLEQAVGQTVALTLLRESGPVVTGLLFVDRVGSVLTTEIGSMEATEQSSSLEMIGAGPLKYIVAPRLWAGLIPISLPAVILSVVGIQGGMTVAADWLGVYEGSSWVSIQNSVQLTEDVLNGAIKSIVFVFVVTWIAVYQGYDCELTLEGISQVTTRTVVYASLAVSGLDFILTALMFGDF